MYSYKAFLLNEITKVFCCTEKMPALIFIPVFCLILIVVSLVDENCMISQIQTFFILLCRMNASINIHFDVLLYSGFLWLMRIVLFLQIQKIFTHTGIETPHLHPSVVLQKKSQVGLGWISKGDRVHVLLEMTKSCFVNIRQIQN